MTGELYFYTAASVSAPATGPRDPKVQYVQVAGPGPGEECWTCGHRVPMTPAQRSKRYRAMRRLASAPAAIIAMTNEERRSLEDPA